MRKSRFGDKAIAQVAKQAASGTHERDIMCQTGHRSVQMLRCSIHDADLFRDNAAAIAGL